MAELPTSVSIREVGPRDGLQNEEPIPTDSKVKLLDALSRTGVRRIEAVSFVHPKAIPQMADADEVWQRAEKVDGVRYSALVPNTRGAQRALAAGFTEIEVVVSASDTHNRRNVNRATDESLDDIAELIALLHAAGATAEVIVATSFGCPYEGDVDPTRVAAIVDRVVRDGADRVAFGDTTGMGTPRRVRELVTAVRDRNAQVPVLLHFHNTRGTALANMLTAMELGGHRVRRQRRWSRRLPVRPGGERQPGHRGGGAHAARHGHRDRHRPGRPDRGGRAGRAPARQEAPLRRPPSRPPNPPDPPPVLTPSLPSPPLSPLILHFRPLSCVFCAACRGRKCKIAEVGVGGGGGSPERVGVG